MKFQGSVTFMCNKDNKQVSFTQLQETVARFFREKGTFTFVEKWAGVYTPRTLLVAALLYCSFISDVLYSDTHMNAVRKSIWS